VGSSTTLGLVAATGAPFAASLVLAGLVVVLSVVPLGAARSQANFTMADLQAPRAMFERLPAWGKRASWAHQNSLEAFSLHAPACLLCLLAGAVSRRRRPRNGTPSPSRHTPRARTTP
jgi:uncharacterized MAPEG superfamily protein